MKRLLCKRGVGTVEIVIILAVLVGIALLFRSAITEFIQNILNGTINDPSIVDKLRIE